MGLFSKFSEWNHARQEKFLSEMEALGSCPDCRGRGFNSYTPNEFYYSNVYDCPGCNGSGLYSDWAESQAEM
ncbi:methionine aminopeptidase [Peribacillus deserti]|uniref:Methionine aminopeptidase n=1 Tax=Peribacillus deserti TaxID=673318 RepID=A0A2N5MC17_9BACI|nr:methionine aminopeptidase [Peribacillus deserti]PLT31887.1 methionine aminopeptidase [Peribacillus deserti]